MRVRGAAAREKGSLSAVRHEPAAAAGLDWGVSACKAEERGSCSREGGARRALTDKQDGQRKRAQGS